MKAWCGFTADHLEALDEGRSQASRANQAVLTVPKDPCRHGDVHNIEQSPCLLALTLALSVSLSFVRQNNAGQCKRQARC